jgi:hypothetical protein
MGAGAGYSRRPPVNDCAAQIARRMPIITAIDFMTKCRACTFVNSPWRLGAWPGDSVSPGLQHACRSDQRQKGR